MSESLFKFAIMRIHSSMKSLVILLSTICVVGTTSSALGSESSSIDIQSFASQQLAKALREQFADVERFELAPLDGQLSVDGAGHILGTRVTSIGTRSAVRVAYEMHNVARIRTFWFAVKGLQSVVVASRNIPPLADLSNSDGELVEHDVLAKACVPIRAVSLLSGKRTRRALHGGDMICSEDVDLRPAVAKGDAVTVRYEAERVSLTSKAVARQDARIGDRIVVVNPTTQEAFLARVTADKEVQVNAR